MILCFINVYSDNQQFTLKYLKDTKVNLNDTLIITGDFNIRDNNWNLLYLYYSIYVDILREISDNFNLELSISINHIPT